MRTVTNSREVAHMWANQTQSRARNSNCSLFFEDKTLYSYGHHYPLAQLVTLDILTVVLVNVSTRNRGGSMTTAKHRSQLRRAISQHTSFDVVDPFVCEERSWTGHGHEINVQYLTAQVQDSYTKALSSIKPEYIRRSYDATLRALKNLREYCELFELPVPEVVGSKESDAELVYARIEKMRQRAELRATPEYRAKAKAEYERKHAGILAVVKAAIARKCDAWRAGDNYSLNLYDVARQLGISRQLRRNLELGIPTMLRLSRDGKEVETSHGARVPVSHAVRALGWVRNVVERGVEFKPNGHSFHIGPYTVSHIGTDGTLVAGCHTIKYDEIVRFAAVLDTLPAVYEVQSLPQA